MLIVNVAKEEARLLVHLPDGDQDRAVCLAYSSVPSGQSGVHGHVVPGALHDAFLIWYQKTTKLVFLSYLLL
jgi:hypothetical protein